VTGVPDGQLFLDTLFSTVNCVHEVKSVKKTIHLTHTGPKYNNAGRKRDIQIG
jgi:hypothetical protein